MLVRIGFARILGGFTSLGEFFVTLARDGENVFDLMRLARHLVEYEFELRGQTQTGLGAHEGTQTTLGLVQCLLCTAAFALLMAFTAKLGPIDFGDLQIVGHTHFGDGHVCETLIVQLRLHGGCDHTLDQRRDACGARIGSCHCCPLIR